MATRQQQVPPTAQAAGGLCDHCQKKPKFSNHNYCSKTCASQAASLCNHCHKKPKFQNFDFCGKTCAAQAGSTLNQSNKQQAPLGKSNTPNVPNNNQRSNTKGSGPSNRSGNANTIDPMQIAKLVVQQIPQLQAFIPPQLLQTGQQLYAQATQATQQQAYPQSFPAPASVPAASAQTRAAPVSNPFDPDQSGSSDPNAPPYNSTLFSNAPPGSGSTTFTVHQAPAPRTDCRIPGCGKPVHIDAQGYYSEYCSLKHRE
ncbi:hypothetical protein WG66_010647 [Moniliophthora roreri]|nr:hypothetical protein WG66_010647 [Moniliophthora roreri]